MLAGLNYLNLLLGYAQRLGFAQRHLPWLGSSNRFHLDSHR